MGKAVCDSPRSEVQKASRVFEQMDLQLLDPGHHKKNHRDRME